jgi:hypothetical protein
MRTSSGSAKPLGRGNAEDAWSDSVRSEIRQSADGDTSAVIRGSDASFGVDSVTVEDDTLLVEVTWVTDVAGSETDSEFADVPDDSSDVPQETNVAVETIVTTKTNASGDDGFIEET